MTDTVVDEYRQADGRPVPLHVIQPRRNPGRPTLYTPGMVTEICRLVQKGCSLRVIAAQPGLPSKSKMLEWLAKYPDFRETFDAAKQVAATGLVDEIIDIADDSDPNEAPKTKLRIDARKFTAAKNDSKRFGEKVEHALVVSAAQEDQTAICRRMAYLLARNVAVPQLGSDAPVIDATPVDPPNES